MSYMLHEILSEENPQSEQPSVPLNMTGLFVARISGRRQARVVSTGFYRTVILRTKILITSSGLSGLGCKGLQ